jgi:hypothetical protein
MHAYYAHMHVQIKVTWMKIELSLQEKVQKNLQEQFLQLFRPNGLMRRLLSFFD